MTVNKNIQNHPCDGCTKPKEVTFTDGEADFDPCNGCMVLYFYEKQQKK